MTKKKIAINPAPIPPYQKEFYSWLYESNRLTKLFDRQWLLNLLSFGYNHKLAKSVLDEVVSHSKVLQMGVTFGEQMNDLADKIGVYGKYDVVDVSTTQLRYVRNKYRFIYPYMNFINRDALEPFTEKYDVVICYMLLHELPLPAKSRLINQALSGLTPGGKAIFIDYNNMVWWHPLKWFVKMYNRLYQPFAERMWQTEIKDYVTDRQQFEWRKTTYFGKMYQKVVVTKKSSLF
ncbi:MAG: rhodoquinone biosynthesis methyltransferase RquA [Alphaproteobacteria bacterium]|nr:rhodoquinone biosynthesis methyltransferase RquA [Alphaproteobacteria bacterium]